MDSRLEMDSDLEVVMKTRRRWLQHRDREE